MGSKYDPDLPPAQKDALNGIGGSNPLAPMATAHEVEIARDVTERAAARRAKAIEPRPIDPVGIQATKGGDREVG